MYYGESIGHLIDHVRWPWKVKVVTQKCSGPLSRKRWRYSLGYNKAPIGNVSKKYQMVTCMTDDLSEVLIIISVCLGASKCTIAWIHRPNRYNARSHALHGAGIITSLYFAIFAAFKESMTLNLAHGSFKVINFGTNRKWWSIATWTLPCTVSEMWRLKCRKSTFSLPHSYSGWTEKIFWHFLAHSVFLSKKSHGIGQTPCSYEHYLVEN